MIQVIRNNRKATNRYPEFYTCHYYYYGEEIANYDSRQDIIYLNSMCLKTDKSLNEYERALSGSYADAYKELFEMLNSDETTSFSESINVSFELL